MLSTTCKIYTSSFELPLSILQYSICLSAIPMRQTISYRNCSQPRAMTMTNMNNHHSPCYIDMTLQLIISDWDWSKYIKNHLTTNPKEVFQNSNPSMISMSCSYIFTYSMGLDCCFSVTRSIYGDPTKTQRGSKQLRPTTSPKSMVRTERPKEFCMAKLEQASRSQNVPRSGLIQPERKSPGCSRLICG